MPNTFHILLTMRKKNTMAHTGKYAKGRQNTKDLLCMRDILAIFIYKIDTNLLSTVLFYDTGRKMSQRSKVL